MVPNRTPVWRQGFDIKSVIARLHRPMNYSWRLAVIQGLFLIGASYWFQIPPSSGVTVVVLGLVAVVMAIRAEEEWGRPERMAWLILAVTLSVVAIRAITREDDDRDRRFASIIQDLQKSIQTSDQQFRVTTNKQNALLGVTNSVATLSAKNLEKMKSVLENEKQVLKVSTGGDGFCYLATMRPLPPAPVPAREWPLSLGNSGDVPIPFCDITIIEIPAPQDSLQEKIRKYTRPVSYRFTTVAAQEGHAVMSTPYSITPGPSYQILIHTPTRAFEEELAFTPGPPILGGYHTNCKVYKMYDKSRKVLLDCSF